MSYKGYSFNLHKEDDKELIKWLSNKKITKTIKIALYNQMNFNAGKTEDDNSMELLSVIRKAIENNSANNEQSIVARRKDIVGVQNNDKKSLNDEDIEMFEKIFDI